MRSSVGLLPGRRLFLPLPSGYQVRDSGNTLWLCYGSEEIIARFDRAVPFDDAMQLLREHVEERILHGAVLLSIVHCGGRP
jgi:hypothetical protein